MPKKPIFMDRTLQQFQLLNNKKWETYSSLRRSGSLVFLLRRDFGELNITFLGSRCGGSKKGDETVKRESAR